MTSDFGSRGQPAGANPWPGRIALALGGFIVFFWGLVLTAEAIGKASHDAAEPIAPAALASVAVEAGKGVGITAAVVAGLLFLFFIGPAGRPGRWLRYFGAIAAAGASCLVLGFGGFQLIQPSVAADKKVEELVGAHRSQMDADDAAFTAEMAGAGIRPDDDVSRMAANLPAAARNVETAYEIVDKYDALRDTRIKATREKVAAVAVDQGQRTRYLAEIDAGWREAGPLLDRRWALERRALGVREEIINLLKRTRGRWQVTGPMMRFARQSELDEAQRLVNDMNQIRRDRRKLKRDVDVYMAKSEGKPPPPEDPVDFFDEIPVTPVDAPVVR